MKKLKTAIIGQGRSGRDIHGRFFHSEGNAYCDVVAVVELDAERRELAKQEWPGAAVYADYRELYARDDLDLVVNATFSDTHYSITKELLEHGLNVVVEKPMARNYYECCQMIRAAEKSGAVLAVFQQSFLAPYYRKVKEIIASGKLGDIQQVSIHFSGFARRWDWQTMQVRLGGSVYNTGPHPLGFALDFLDFDPQARVAFSKLALSHTSGDAEDYAKILLTAPGKPVVDVEISSTNAYSDYNILVQGTRGCLKTTTVAMQLKYYTDAENPAQPLQPETLKINGCLPNYCAEALVTHEEKLEFKGTAFDSATHDFYEMLYKKLVNDVPMTVTPQMAAMIVNVIETVHAQNPLPVKY